ncbi:Rrg10 protein [Scheffersomyces amazonensis]|uniref:Rrg10 protein n=1 Tax=Scheffersomyces amazonensis TaxID=1078765 RepID=UPI00315C7EA3
MFASAIRMGKIVGAPKGHDRYRDPLTHQITPALYRVRAPFFKRNVIGFVLVSAIPLGVYMYTWSFLSKDEFSDIPIPPIDDAELKQLQAEYEAKKKQQS